jgi:hypothetical protein
MCLFRSCFRSVKVKTELTDFDEPNFRQACLCIWYCPHFSEAVLQTSDYNKRVVHKHSVEETHSCKVYIGIQKIIYVRFKLSLLECVGMYIVALAQAGASLHWNLVFMTITASFVYGPLRGL